MMRVGIAPCSPFSVTNDCMEGGEARHHSASPHRRPRRTAAGGGAAVAADAATCLPTCHRLAGPAGCLALALPSPFARPTTTSPSPPTCPLSCQAGPAVPAGAPAHAPGGEPSGHHLQREDLWLPPGALPAVSSLPCLEAAPVPGARRVMAAPWPGLWPLHQVFWLAGRANAADLPTCACLLPSRRRCCLPAGRWAGTAATAGLRTA